MKKIFGLILMVFVLGGCATSTITGNKMFESRYQQIQKGATTSEQVIALLGDPMQVVYPTEDKKVMIYEKRIIHPARSHWGTQPTQQVDVERLTVFIGPDNIVSDYKRDSVGDEVLLAPVGGGAYQQPSNNAAAYYSPPPRTYRSR